ncbi:MAG: hypothetical protein ACAI34_13455, partial [Verrucomicrobium sp.]
MFLWTGNGLFIPLIAILAFFLGSSVMDLIAPPSPFWSTASILGIIMLSLYGFSRSRFGRTTSYPGFDRHSRENIVQHRRHSFLLIPSRGWAALALMPTLVMIVIAILIPQEAIDLFTGVQTPAEKSWGLAHIRTMSLEYGLGQGNTPEAVALAERYATRLKGIRDGGMVEIDARKDPFNYGQFITFCQLNQDACVFLVNVPELRKLNREARDFIANAAWQVADECAKTLPAKPAHLVVGIRGVLTYDRVLTGPVGSPSLPPVQHSSKEARQKLAMYFLEPGSGGSVNFASTAVDAAPSSDGLIRPLAAASASRNKVPITTAATLLPTPVREWRGADGRSLRGNLVRFANATGEAALFVREDDGLL